MSVISVSFFTRDKIPATVLAVFLLASSMSLSLELDSFVKQVVLPSLVEPVETFLERVNLNKDEMMDHMGEMRDRWLWRCFRV